MSAGTNDRAAGAIVGMAAGDALGASYEFTPSFPDDFVPEMRAGGSFGWEAGEWTDDTSMAVPILQAAARGDRLEEPRVLGDIVAAWKDWARGAKDVGAQTRQVLSSIGEVDEEHAREASRRLHEAAGRSGGNGSLMRTAPVALQYLDDPDGLVVAARRISELTHWEQDAGDACVLWCLAIRHAILTSEIDLRGGLQRLPEDRRERWGALIDEAERKQPRDFPKNGWVVQALQGAWSAITSTPAPERMPARHLRLALEAAVCGGNDTDTVAAIAGGLLGARWGVSAVPAHWRRLLHGWPGLDARDLVRLAVVAANGGKNDSQGWPSAATLSSPYRTIIRHPHDDGVWLGGLGALADLPQEIDAVVSLCRTGALQTDREQVEMWLIDQPDAARNPNLDLVLADAADVIDELRQEGKQVFVHCFQGASRTPTVGALYAARHMGVPVNRAIREVTAALPDGAPALFLQEAIRRIAEGD